MHTIKLLNYPCDIVTQRAPECQEAGTVGAGRISSEQRTCWCLFPGNRASPTGGLHVGCRLPPTGKTLNCFVGLLLPLGFSFPHLAF